MAINGAAVFRVRTGGNNVNGGGYDASIASAGTDYSQQDAAQLSGSVGTAAGTTTFTDATATFTAAMIGNGLWIASGAGFTAGLYFVITRTSNTQITLDRSPGTGSAAVWKLGGAWADPWTRLTSAGALVPGNTVYVRGSGGNYPTSDDYATTGVTTLMQGTTAGLIRIIGENGRPRIASNGGLYTAVQFTYFESLYISTNGTSGGGVGIIEMPDSGGCQFSYNCTFDKNGYDIPAIQGRGMSLAQCEVVDTHAARGTSAQPAINMLHFGGLVYASNIHNCIGPGISTEAYLGLFILNSVIAKNGAGGVVCTNDSNTGEGNGSAIVGNTFDANAGSAITYTVAGQLIENLTFNNLITNHVTASTYGLNANFGTVAANDRLKAWVNYNFFYGNTTDVIGLTLNSGTMLGNVTGTNPGYAAQSTEGYAIGTALRSAAYPQAVFPNATAGQTATRSYVSPGAVQRITPAAANSNGSLLLLGVGD